MYKRILVATDGSELSHVAVQHALRLAQATRAEVVALKVVPKYPQSYFEGSVVLAAFMRILTPPFVRHYSGRLLNIHPSLLPKHKGLNTHQRALDAQDSEHGCSVHFVSEELDGGPLIIQAVVPVEPGDTAETLALRVHMQEHRIYPTAVRWFAEGRLRLAAEGALLDGEKLPATGYLIRT